MGIKHFEPLGRKPENPTVFVLVECDWSYNGIVGVFRSYKQAEKYAKTKPLRAGAYYKMKEFEVAQG